MKKQSIKRKLRDNIIGFFDKYGVEEVDFGSHKLKIRQLKRAKGNETTKKAKET